MDYDELHKQFLAELRGKGRAADGYGAPIRRYLDFIRERGLELGGDSLTDFQDWLEQSEEGSPNTKAAWVSRARRFVRFAQKRGGADRLDVEGARAVLAEAEASQGQGAVSDGVIIGGDSDEAEREKQHRGARLAVYVPETTAKLLKVLAWGEARSASDVINEALEQYINAHIDEAEIYEESMTRFQALRERGK